MVRRTVLGRYLIPLIVGMGILWITNTAAANEVRCNELGAACLCSEPLNTNVYVQDVTHFRNPADTTTKECTMLGSGGSAIDTQQVWANYSVVTSGEAFNNLPAAASGINFILQSNNGGFHGHTLGGGDPTARVALRFYKYFSTDIGLTGGGCLNSNKTAELFGEFRTMLVFEGLDGVDSLYGWGGGGPSWNVAPIDRCHFGPGPRSAPAYDAGTMAGKWWRYEISLTNRLPTGSPSRIQMWRKNVTDNSAEELVIDTSMATLGQGQDDWTSTDASTLKPTVTVNQIASVFFRNGTCNGWYGITHLLAAGWNTDAGQRIGAAAEIEDGTSVSIIPTPLNLRIN